MPVLMLKDGRWIVYFYGWVMGMKKKMREYFGRGPNAEIRARARDEAIKRDRLQAIVYGGLTFKDLADAYSAAKCIPTGGMSLTDQSATLYKLNSIILPFWGKHKALSINEGLCEKYFKKRTQKDKVMSVTVRREMQIIQAILNFATTEKAGRLIPYNPIKGAKLPKNDSKPICPPTHEQVLKIYRKACSYLRRAILLSANTGARVGSSELLQIDWEHVGFEDNVITVVSALKNADIPYRRIPIMPEFLEMLKRWRAEDAAARKVEVDELSGPIIHYKGKPVKRLNMAWRKALAKTTIEQRIRPYDLRHFFATHLVEQGASLKVTGTLMGHSDEETTKRYSASATPEARDEIKKQVRLNRMVLEEERGRGLVTG